MFLSAALLAQVTYIQLFDPGIREASGLDRILVRSSCPPRPRLLVLLMLAAWADLLAIGRLGAAASAGCWVPSRKTAVAAPSTTPQPARLHIRERPSFPSSPQDGGVVVFDEGHNVPHAARDAATLELEARQLLVAIPQLARAVNLVRREPAGRGDEIWDRIQAAAVRAGEELLRRAFSERQNATLDPYACFLASRLLSDSHPVGFRSGFLPARQVHPGRS